MHVYTYWKCNSCDSIIRGDSRTCPNCGTPIPNNVKYMMPDNPTIVAAMKAGTILTGDKKIHTDEKGIQSEIVETKDERNLPNWKCHYCGYQNFAEDTSCRGCGVAKSNDTYYEKISVKSDEDEGSYEDERSYDNDFTEIVDEYDEPVKEEPTKISTPYTPKPKQKISIWKNIVDFLAHIDGRVYLAVFALLFFVPFFIWLFTPVQRESRVTSFSWERSIDVETYTLCHEDGWSVPAGAVVTDEREEIHHYDQVLDHYETKSKQVSERVLVGYDTEYRDLGNGQAEVVQTPVYETQYHTEYYEEPVYKSVPVYKTKYYYDIGRWKYSTSLRTSGFDQNAYWYDTSYPTSVTNPNYGDIRQGDRHETYRVNLINYNDEKSTITYNYNDWMSLQVGDILRYKSFRFTDQPLSEVEVKRTNSASN